LVEGFIYIKAHNKVTPHTSSKLSLTAVQNKECRWKPAGKAATTENTRKCNNNTTENTYTIENTHNTYNNNKNNTNNTITDTNLEREKRKKREYKRSD